ncbi:PDZ domain-containing protein [Sphingobacterium sp. SGG-5]|uniref:PDZ domain-containing protein n=1 Tax=Sphingobacterium sp. SGG-5 TaxID=2710881 RepID=UPI0013EA86D3|nr:PDZ domain-containing protein [Sphingobacterium sp. SGG-5]NGM62605.1 PDZ domain-containing protein [Sphingobacterium sp. SGG-5]
MRNILYFLVFFSPCTFAQGIFRLPDDKPHSFKFELVNNAVLVPVTINGMAFTFLLDTGVKETILFAHTEDSVYLHNPNKITFHGIGSEDNIEGILSMGNLMTVGKIAVDTLHWIYVVQADDLDISSDIGVAINGILGSRFFNSFPMRINYQKSKITLYPPSYNYNKTLKGYHKTKISIENDRPYIQAKIQVDEDWKDMKMLIDMGNTDPLTLFPSMLPHFTIKRPFVEEYLGRGINGAIHGKRNRIRKVGIGTFELAYPIVSYPDSNAVFKNKLVKDRAGSIDNQTLQRFHLLIDYAREEIYWKKNKMFHRPFLVNMAGIDIKHDGMIWTKIWAPITGHKKELNFQYNFVLKPRYKIAGLRKHSPAAQAGVQTGDILLKINGIQTKHLSLSKIMNKLQSHPGDEIRLTLQRGTDTKNIRFHLEDPIPY